MRICRYTIYLSLLLAFIQAPWIHAQDPVPGEQNGEARTLEEALLQAQQRFEENQLDEALEWAKKAEEMAPDKMDTLMILGRIYLAQAAGIERFTGFAGMFKRDLLGEAEEAFRKALEIDPKNAWARNHLAFALLLLKNLPAARDALNRVFKDDPQDAYAHYLLGEIQLLEGDGERAAASFRKSIELDKEDLNARAGLIRALIDREERKSAVQEIRQILQLNKELPELLVLAQMIYEPVELYDQSAGLYRTLLEMAPDRNDIRFRLGYVLFKLDRKDEAESSFDEVLVRDPAHQGSLYSKACLRMMAGSHGEARTFFEKVAQPESAYFASTLDELHRLALKIAEKNSFDEALDIFDFILSRNPTDTAVMSNRALTLTKSGKKAEADAAFKEIIALDPWDSSILNNFALHLFGTGRTAEALELLEAAVKVDGNLDALENQGSYYYYRLGDSTKANKKFRLVLEADPERTKALVLHELLKMGL